MERADAAAVWAVRLADEPLSAADQADFDAWLDAHPDNAQAVEEIIGAWRAVESYATSDPIVAMRRAALATAHRAPRNASSRWSARQFGWIAAAACLLLMVVSGGAWMLFAPQVYTTGIGERRVVALSDGSKISLDGATTVKVDYDGDSRRLWLDSGRAKFDVAKDPLRPFSVTAADKVVVATGTAFSVERVQREVRVVLYEGHVAVLELDPARKSRPVRIANGASLAPAERLLKPGSELILADDVLRPSDVQAAKLMPIDPVRSLSWEAGQLVFEDEKLDVVVERMNRYADRPLSIADKALANTRISGVFHAGDMNALVQGLSAFGLKVRAGDNTEILFAPAKS
jgi:transmembrane sensor